MIENSELIKKAREVVNPRKLSPTVEVGGVGAALITDKGNVFVGVCIDAASGIGFCAEHNAIGNMITNGESKIHTIVAVDWDGQVMSPCGRCRELIYQIDPYNRDTNVILKNDRIVKLRELLPEHWTDEK